VQLEGHQGKQVWEAFKSQLRRDEEAAHGYQCSMQLPERQGMLQEISKGSCSLHLEGF
jgi:hypothetical protein